MFVVLPDKISLSGLAAGAEEIELPKKAVRRILLGCNYTIVDPSIVAGEDVDGWISSIRIIADNKEIFRVDRNELRKVVDLLGPYGTDSVEDPEDLDVVPTTAFRHDGLPVTTELQRTFYVFNLPHDFSRYKSVKMRIEWRAVTDEWPSATGMTAKFSVGLQLGNVPRSLTVTRVSSGSSTEHQLTMGDYPVINAMFLAGAWNVYKELKMPGKDGNNDVDCNELSLLQAMYNAMIGIEPSTDDVAYLTTGPILIPTYPNRMCHLSLDSTATLVAFFVGIAAEHRITEGVHNRGEVARGTAKLPERDYTAEKGNVINRAARKVKPPMFPMG